MPALVNNGGDRIAFHLDAEPDRNKFDLGARVIAPADGLVPAMIGTQRAINLAIGGKGSWTRWRGTAALDLSGRPDRAARARRRQRPLPAAGQVGAGANS